MDIGFFLGIVSRALLNSFYGIHVLAILIVAHALKEELFGGEQVSREKTQILSHPLIWWPASGFGYCPTHTGLLLRNLGQVTIIQIPY